MRDKVYRTPRFLSDKPDSVDFGSDVRGRKAIGKHAYLSYLLEGDVVVTPEGGDPVHVAKGDLVTFPSGMSCTWEIRQAVRKHYTFD